MDKKRVLVVDDDQDLLNMLKLRIESEGFEFMVAHDGEDMLKVIKLKRPDAIVLDIMLPKMDGYTALREMRNQDEFKDIPVIILTAKEKKRLGDLFALEGIAHFVEKPYNTNDLMQKIRSVF
jgi:DNA-binding response OmpR family regulator